MPLGKLDHVNVRTAQLDKMIAWYEDVLEMEVGPRPNFPFPGAWLYADGAAGFEDKYFEMLKAGGSKHHKELLAPFGLDASDPTFWDKGLSMIAGFIDELEAMEG